MANIRTSKSLGAPNIDDIVQNGQVIAAPLMDFIRFSLSEHDANRRETYQDVTHLSNVIDTLTVGTLTADQIISKINDESSTTISGGKITTDSITVDHLDFTPGDVSSDSIIGSINASSEGIVISSSKISLSGVVTVGGAAADVNSGSTTISGGKITAYSINVDRLSFTPGNVSSSSIIATINASTEGITINASKLTLTGVLQVGGAAADVNSGTTTISATKISTGDLDCTNINVKNLTVSGAFTIASDGTGTIEDDAVGTDQVVDGAITDNEFYEYAANFIIVGDAPANNSIANCSGVIGVSVVDGSAGDNVQIKAMIPTYNTTTSQNHVVYAVMAQHYGCDTVICDGIKWFCKQTHAPSSLTKPGLTGDEYNKLWVPYGTSTEIDTWSASHSGDYEQGTIAYPSNVSTMPKTLQYSTSHGGSSISMSVTDASPRSGEVFYAVHVMYYQADGTSPTADTEQVFGYCNINATIFKK